MPEPWPSHAYMSQHACRSGRRANPRWQHLTGAAAEDLVARHLEGRGCRIVARRFRCKGGEIDLVVGDGEVTAFVEVKARRSSRFGHAAEAVTWRKRRRLAIAARAFLRARDRPPGRCRFDVACVELRAGRASVEWIRDAFRV